MTPLYAGDQLDDYHLDTLVASSGMATLFRATDLRDGSAAAIKVPHPQAECDPIFHERFRREIEIGARLQHPGIRKILPPADQSRLYMAMEWLDGRLLATGPRRRRPILHSAHRIASRSRSWMRWITCTATALCIAI